MAKARATAPHGGAAARRMHVSARRQKSHTPHDPKASIRKEAGAPEKDCREAELGHAQLQMIRRVAKREGTAANAEREAFMERTAGPAKTYSKKMPNRVAAPRAPAARERGGANPAEMGRVPWLRAGRSAARQAAYVQCGGLGVPFACLPGAGGASTSIGR